MSSSASSHERQLAAKPDPWSSPLCPSERLAARSLVVLATAEPTRRERRRAIERAGELLKLVLVEVQVAGLELGHAFEAAPVADGQLPVLELDEPAAAKLLQRSVRVNHGQPEALRKLALG